MAFVNKPEGRGYNEAYGALMRADGLDPTDKMWSHVLWLNEEPERMQVLRELRAEMTPGQRSRLNSPISARQRVEKVLKARESGTEEQLRMSPVALLKQKLVEAERTNAHLQERLASAERRLEDGSLFDLKHDSADDIADVIVRNASESKASTISKRIADKLKSKKKPAG